MPRLLLLFALAVSLDACTDASATRPAGAGASAPAPARKPTPGTGPCSPACASGLSCCAGRCVAIVGDPFNCGGCGVVCEGKTPFCQGRCTERPCRRACASAETCCGDRCCPAGQDLLPTHGRSARTRLHKARRRDLSDRQLSGLPVATRAHHRLARRSRAEPRTGGSTRNRAPSRHGVCVWQLRKTSVPGPPIQTSCNPPPLRTSSPAPPSRRSSPVSPIRLSLLFSPNRRS